MLKFLSLGSSSSGNCYYLATDNVQILVDAGVPVRSLKHDLKERGLALNNIDAVFITHTDKDHTGGLDDIRAFNYLEKKASEIYCEKYVEDSLRQEYSYAFAEVKYPGAPEWNVHIIDEKPFSINGVEIIPIRGKHFKLPVLGFRFGDIAYCTDMNHIPEEEYSKLQGLDHFIINCVRRGRHISHYSLEQAMEVAEKVGAKHSWLTHLSHQLPCHEELTKELPEGILPAFDGLVIE